MPYGTVNADLVVGTNGGKLSPENTFGFRNRIINGAMVIDQRNAGASSTPTVAGTYTVDRFNLNFSQTSKLIAQQNRGSVTPPVGYTNYLGVGVSATATIGTTDYFEIVQPIEGFNVADLAWGTANAKTVTLSFWVYSNTTGIYGGVFRNAASSRSYPYTYTINSANTWEQKSITVAGDTSSTWGTNNGIGIYLNFSLAMGSTYQGTAGSWLGGTYGSCTGQTNLLASTSNYFYITGVQLEVGSNATSFEYRPINTELAMCQRYFVKSYAQSVTVPTNSSGGFLRTRSYGTSYGAFVWNLPVTMRTAPTASIYNQNTSAVNSWYNTDTPSSVAANVSSTGEQSITVESSALTVNNTYLFQLTGSSEL